MKRLLLFAVAFLVLAACEKDKVQKPLEGIEGGAVSIDAAVIDPLGSEVNFIIATEDQWYVTVTGNDNSWLTLSNKNSGSNKNVVTGSAGTTELMFSAAPNNSGLDRECRVWFRSNSFEKTIVVSQECPRLEVGSVSANLASSYDRKIEIPFEWYDHVASTDHPEKFRIPVKSNIPWRIVPQITSTKSEDGESSVDYAALLYSGVSEEWIRYAAVMYEGRSDNWIKSYVYYDGKEIPISTDGGFDGKGNADLAFSPEWYNIEEQRYTLRYVVVPDSRSTRLREITLEFSQPNLRFTADWEPVEGEPAMEYDAAYVEPRMLNVYCERPWKLEEISEWLTLSRTGGSQILLGQTEMPSGASSVTLDAEVNPTGEMRYGTVSLVMNAEGIEASRPIAVQQRRYVFNVGCVNSVSIENGDVSTYAVDVRSSGKWAIEQNQSSRSWFTVSTRTCDGGTVDRTAADEMGTVMETFEFKANAKNPDTTGRTAVLNVAPVDSKAKASLGKTIEITQAPFQWNVEPERTDFGARASVDNKLDLELTCSDAWEISVAYLQSDNRDWLEFSESSGTECNKKVIQFYPLSENMSESPRSARVTVTSTYNGLTKTFVVNQRGINFGLTKDELTTVTCNFAEFNAPSQTIEIMSSHEWKVQSYPIWVSIALYGTQDDGSITINVVNNVSMSPRTDEIKLYSRQNNKDKYCTIKIVQNAFRFSLDTKSFTNIRAYSQGATYISNLSASAGWGVENSSWVSASPTNGSGDRQLAFTVASNPSTSSRTCTVNVVSGEGGYEEAVTFSQVGYNFNVSAKSSYTFEPLNNSPQSFNVICSGPWEFENKPSWINATPGSDNGSDANEDAAQGVTISVSNYTGTTDREGTFSLVSNVGGTRHAKTISVTQKKYVFNVDKSSYMETLKLDALNPGTRSFSITCSGSWTVSSNSSWTKVSQSDQSGSGSRTITVSFDPNYNKDERSSAIIVRSVDNSALSATLNITHKAFEYDTVPVTLETFSNVSPTPQSVSMPYGTMGGWTVKTNNDWIEIVSPTDLKGSGSGTVTINVKNNLELNSRTGTVEIVSDLNPSLKKMVTVKQYAFEFDSDAVTLEFDADAKDGKSVDIKCAGGWKASVPSSDSWVTIDPKSGDGNATVKITPSANSGKERSTVVKVVSDLDDKYVKEITVKQKAK